MPHRDDQLPPGLYEQLITFGLKSRLKRFDPESYRIFRDPLDPADAHAALARHVESVVARALKSLPEDERVARQAEIANQLINSLAALGSITPDDAISEPPEALRAIQEAASLPGGQSGVPAPLVPLSASDLLVNARGEPGLARNLSMEIPSSDSIDLLCAFVRWHGIRVLEAELAAHCKAGRKLRVLTTVYTGSTEQKALDWLVAQGAEVRVSYDTQSTRLHAKAWLFKRRTGFSTAYIGSSNLSKSALIDGQEWNVRLSEVTSPEILEKFEATFEQYWLSSEYQPYDAARFRDEIRRASGTASPGAMPGPLVFLDVRPWPHQEEVLEKLAAERVRHGRHRNLVVAATGTGKTMVAALDYRRLVKERGDLSLLFIAHRQEILNQSVWTFRHVLRDGSWGELYVDGDRPERWRHVFASIQSLSTLDLTKLPPNRFDVVIVDEFHHAAAPTYRRVLAHLQPQELLGLTATPERSDGESVLGYFDGHIAAELRLWDALDRGLLSPFQYFGLADNTDLSGVQWSRRGYDVAELERIYTGNDARVSLVLKQLAEKHRDPTAMRALGFCVSIEHAKFMAKRFAEAGLPSAAVHGFTDSDDRSSAVQDLRAGRLRAIFTVDLFNEGVDIPEVDTLLFLRPTESALVFLQQLGRGLRRHEDKDCVTVLDFIGQSNRKFRFDLRYRAVTGATRTEVERQIQENFPFLPAGCTMQLDRVAAKIVLDNLKSAIPSVRPAMVRELQELARSDRFAGREISLSDFLAESGLDLDDVYRSGCWSGLRRSAGLTVPAAGPQEDTLGKALHRLLHIDDPQRITAYRAALTGEPFEARVLHGLHFTLWNRDTYPATLNESLGILRQHPALVQELLELLSLLEDRAEHLTYPLDTPAGVPLSVHARHSLNEILAAFGKIEPGRFFQNQAGVLWDEDTRSDLFFITLEKSEKHYSPKTLYKDYAMAPDLFHWESQSTTSQRSKTGQRYIHHQEQGTNVLLFVRQRRNEGYRTAPYVFLGPADYVSHQQDRPIQFVWRLRRPMPADFFRQAKVAAG